MLNFRKVGSLVVYKDRATKLYIVRSPQTGKELAHELNMKDALTAARMLIK